MRRKMNKKYTRKQICEAISYWKKQLRAGNYKRVNESVASMPDAKFMIKYKGSEERDFVVFFKDMNVLPSINRMNFIKDRL